MVSVEPLVKFLWKIAYMPLWTSVGRTELHSRNFNEYSTHLCYIQIYWHPQRSSRNNAVLSLPKKLFRSNLLVTVVLCRPAEWK